MIESPRSDVSDVKVSTHVSNSSVILGTARVLVLGPLGQSSLARVLIDPGSEVSLVSEALAQRLGLQRSQARIPLRGVGKSRAQFTRGKTVLAIAPHHEQKRIFEDPAYILPELSKYQPRNLPSPSSWPHVQGLKLADPVYHHSDPVDILLGAESYDLILLEGVKKGPTHTPVAQETHFGWILTGGSGPSNSNCSPDRAEAPVLHSRVDQELMASLSRFWEQEEIEATIPGMEDDIRAEEHFSTTYARLPDGRFMVRLPFKDTPELGDSRHTAVKTLDGLSSRFRRSEEFRLAYQDFLTTYEALGHISSTLPSSGSNSYYLPHHGVLRESSKTTKLRVVFNGSMPSANGKSLNDFLLRGPNLLPNLADVLLRWRRHRFVFSADIEKMYRQILVHPEDRRWQQIVWRSEKRENILDYELNTVTYGLACAPYLAIRCLHQLAQLEELRYPRGSHTVLRDIYMDDVLTGADSLLEARLKLLEVRELLMAGGFPLRKWASNSRELLERLSIDERKGIVEWDSPTLHSVLGIQWLPSSDCFQVSAATSIRNTGYTKRAVLSGTAQLFDPLGWLAPVTIVAKVLMQSLWLLKIDWDAPLPEREELIWQKFQQQLPTLQPIRVPRWLGVSGSKQTIEIHGFADASERAYAAVVYSRVLGEIGVATVSLIAAKSKVAPLKRVSLPRLELCAAFLLAKLVYHITKVLDLRDIGLHLWSDSSVTLSWIQGHPSRWPTYVANRVAEIQRMVPLAKWHHVRSAENPADCASRGLYPTEMVNFELWWRGPEWLSSSGHLPEAVGSEVHHEVTEPLIHHVARRPEGSVCSLIERFSNLTRLLRVLAWCRRWRPGQRKTESILTASEIQACKLTLLQLEQAAHFMEDIRALRKNQPVPSKSRLAKLSPFLDPEGVLRVGGRLQVTNLTYDRKHPAILPDDSALARLWVDAAHKRCLHGGTQLTLSTLRQECWVLKGRHMVKSCIRHCTTCRRWKGQTAQPKMGNLTPCRPFYRSGIDYAGPILLRSNRGRGQLTSKGYIAVFIYLVTKAVHLEAASDGSTDTFLAALRRFMARRGRCSELYSDCGRNFVGANHELRALLRESEKQGGGPFAAASREGIIWRFNPPSAPHFGGLWEAAVKSVKIVEGEKEESTSSPSGDDLAALLRPQVFGRGVRNAYWSVEVHIEHLATVTGLDYISAMHKVKRKRAIQRTGFTKALNAVKDTLGATSDHKATRVAFQMLELKMKDLEETDIQVRDLMFELPDATDEMIEHECKEADDYKNKFLGARIEMDEFSSTLYDAPAIVKEDKFQYLLQAVVPNSRADELVSSFPPTDSNYDKAIAGLRNRFGRENLQIKALSRGKNVEISSLYDKIESHLRALESLGVTTDKCAQETAESDDSKTELVQLIKFLEGEVRNEMRISMAVEGFSFATGDKTECVKQKKEKIHTATDVPTATGLLTTKTKNKTCCSHSDRD
ncbi:uncharacterized protein LOC143217532 [Lasioglossum baleicum]|uniref:uncharacterized protein LOC143217532 n=1 Tax=Lasioglossum baleicum TaxID=434251 RepID=UPI003FCEE4EC